MECAGGTDRLRILAPNWNLAGDGQLLMILQNTHQKIISKCQEVNTSMEVMVNALHDASIDLQNVNNKFMALSNSQFIESRVYDDDVDVTAETKAMQEAPKLVPTDGLSSLKRSLSVLESLHSPVTILQDSETESSDDEHRDRLVLKPKDIYADRPLPYIIGSQAWKSKWHAGLLVEDSDTDSTTSKHADRDSEQYSDSEPELANTANIQTDTLNLPDRTISETSSELPSEQDVLPPVPIKQTPSDIAADLARRLGGPAPKVMHQEPEHSLSKPTVKNTYKPQKPTTGTIFSDEPPPLDQCQSDGEYSQEEDNIFAELQKNKPFPYSNKEQNRIADDLFGFNNNAEKNKPSRDEDIVSNIKGDIFSHFAKDKMLNPTAKQKNTLLDDESEPELFASKSQNEPVKQIEESERRGPKKPIGGISLFGPNNGAESIGAAILNLNRRKSSTSSEESESVRRPEETIPQTKTIDVIDAVKKQKDIFDDLFATSERLQKKNNEDKKEMKVDLFNDNLFDDIDDIFTSNIVKIPVKEPKNNKKSLFSDEDDLFADISVTKTVTSQVTSSNESKKSMFNNDDDLFLDNKSTSKNSNFVITNDEFTKKVEHTAKSDVLDNAKTIVTSKVTSEKSKKNKSIFDSDSNESDIDIFSNIKKLQNEKKLVNAEDIAKDLDTSISQIKNKNILEDHNMKDKSKEQTTDVKTVNKVLKVVTETNKTFQSPILYENDEINDLVVNTNKLNIHNINAPLEDTLDQKQLNTVSDAIDNGDVSCSKIIDNDKSTEFSECYGGIVEEYIIPDQIDNNEELKAIVMETQDNIFDNIESKNELFLKGDNTTLYKSNENRVENKTKLESKVQVENYSTDTQSANVVNDENCALFSMPEESVSDTQNISENYFSEPPLFEKPKEMKKSKNVNALFDDDSDDEALFFKKNDGITDEKPANYAVKDNRNLFGIFHDEPPAIETDLGSGASKQVGFIIDDYDYIITSVPKEIPKNKIEAGVVIPPSSNENYNSSENLFETKVKHLPIKRIEEKVHNNSDFKSDEGLFCVLPKHEVTVLSTKNKDLSYARLEEYHIQTDEVDDSKSKPNEGVINNLIVPTKIGKINTKNFNVNVNALLPGSSPKKYPKDQLDEKAISASYEELSTDKTESEMVKSISFEAEPDSKTLDNQVSKQRAKIQIKRRPSSRRARHEAVRKSGIDIGRDSTNNTISSANPPINIAVIADSKKSTTDYKDKKLQKNFENETKKVTQDSQNKGNTTKIVYVLNDEDIFSTNQHAAKSNKVNPRQKSKVLNIIDDEIDLLKPQKTKPDISDEIKTLGKTYQNETTTSTTKNIRANDTAAKKSIFNDLSDEENQLFNKNKPLAKEAIFDSDSESELFSGKSKKEAAIESKKVFVKESLFGDDNDDDLFGATTKVNSDKSQPSNQSKFAVPKDTLKAMESVFDDPLSMLGVDD